MREQAKIRANEDYPANGIIAVHLYENYPSVRDCGEVLKAADAVELALDEHNLCIVDRAELARLRAAAQPQAQITAEDVRAAERAWNARHLTHNKDKPAFVADYLNRRGERA